ncbi:MAG: hypothetical protein PHQ41_01605 [Candidatus Cloacimonetes bacterium]|nr:hypothetical protein [Candidatus Cloacimonadota bacterium]
MLSSKSVIDAMSAIGSRRAVFYSEHDFQATLACQLQNSCKDSLVIVEYPGVVLDETQDISLDIVVATPANEPHTYDHYLIELKYRFKALRGLRQEQNPLFELIDQGGCQNQKRAFLEKDLRRIEQLYNYGKCYGGCAIFLTNDERYFTPTSNPGEFSLEPDEAQFVNILHDDAKWVRAGLRHDHLGMKWREYGNAGFRYLLIEVNI